MIFFKNKLLKWIALTFLGLFVFNSLTFAQEFNKKKISSLIHHGKYIEAENHLNTLDSNSIEWMYWKNTLSYKLGDYKRVFTKVVKQMNRLDSKNPYFIPYLTLASQITLELEELEQAESYLNLGLAQNNLSNQEKAIINDLLGLVAVEKEDYIKGDSLYKVAENYAITSNVDNFYLGIIWYHQGESFIQKHLPDSADVLLNQAKEHLEIKLGKDHPELGYVYHHLGRLAFNQNDNKSSESALLKALSIRNKKLGENHPEVGRTQFSLAKLAIQEGNFEKADDLYQVILPIFEQTFGKGFRYAQILEQLSIVATALNNDKVAIDYLNQAKDILQETKLWEQYSDVIQKLADALTEQNDTTEAAKLYQQNIDVTKKHLGLNHLQYGLALSSYALFLEIYKEDYEQAEKHYQEALNIIEEIEGERSDLYLSCLNNLAFLYFLTDRYSEAETEFRRIEKLQEETIGPNHPEHIYVLVNLSFLYRSMKETKKTLAYQEKINKLRLDLIQNYYSSFDESTRLNYLKESKEDFDAFYSYLLHLGKLDKKTAQQAQEISLNIKGLALDYHLSAKLKISQSNNLSLKKSYAQYLQKHRELGEAYNLTKSQRITDNIKIEYLKTELSQLEKKLIRGGKEVSVDLSFQKQYPYQELAANLPANEVVIDFIRFNYFSETSGTDTIFYCALINKQELEQPKLIPLTTEKELKKYLTNQLGNHAYARTPRIRDSLYKYIWQPLIPYLKDVNTVHLSAEGLLHKISFGVLKEKEKFLTEQYQFHYYNNLRDFIKRKPIHFSPSISLLGAVNYDYDSLLVAKSEEESILGFLNKDTLENSMRAIASDSTRNAVHFNYLPWTETEVLNIAKQFEATNWTIEVQLASEATEEYIKSFTAQNAPSILHLATHGFFFNPFNTTNTLPSDSTQRTRTITAKNPLLRSGIALYGANYVWKGGKPIPEVENGILTAFEVAELDLSNTSLVVLSACETGLGDIFSSEGVFGLQRAFKSAGVKQLLISLWNVPDQKTAELMNLFYQNFINGSPPAEALSKAQRTMVEKKYSPLDWGGFILLE